MCPRLICSVSYSKVSGARLRFVCVFRSMSEVLILSRRHTLRTKPRSTLFTVVPNFYGATWRPHLEGAILSDP